MHAWLSVALLALVCCGCWAADETTGDKINNAASGIGDAASGVAGSLSKALSGAWDGVAKAAGTTGTWFKENVKSARDLFGSDKKVSKTGTVEEFGDKSKYGKFIHEDLEKKVDDTLKLLEAAKDNVKLLPEDFKKKLDVWVADLKTFKAKVAESSDEEFSTVEKEWETKVKPIYDGGIAKLMGKDDESGASVILPSLAALIIPLVTCWHLGR